jgi:hypothetical protein
LVLKDHAMMATSDDKRLYCAGISDDTGLYCAGMAIKLGSTALAGDE